MKTQLQIKWLLLSTIFLIGGGACSDDETYEFEGKGLILSAESNICMDYTHILNMENKTLPLKLNKKDGKTYVGKYVVVYGHYIPPIECDSVVVVEKIRELKK
ncbi:hypothetical protein [uncultured Parabacteroides sp.]|uniref:hypothetical protein n=1 Tax=uncultured Parabacteroides sp. TaxID=512312 RepID=UPI00280458DB|nr:hypothetical protein [uncultured Parabacteroides sp.]